MVLTNTRAGKKGAIGPRQQLKKRKTPAGKGDGQSKKKQKPETTGISRREGRVRMRN